MRFLSLLTCLLLFTFSAHAQETAPKPAQHPAHELEVKKAQAQKKKAELESQAKDINADMAQTQNDLVAIAAKVKKNEEKLSELDKKIETGRKERSDIEKRLRHDKSSIGDLVLALERLNRTPPEAIIARPGAPLETAQSAMLLQSILPDIYTRAERLKKDLDRLQVLVTSLEKDQEEVKATAADLAGKQKDMSALLEKRKNIYAKTQKDIQLSDSALREIAAQAKNLQDLVALIEKRKKEEEQERTKVASAGTESIIEDNEIVRVLRPTPIPKAGASQLPVSGVIRTGYKQTNDIGAESQGLTIESRAGALVVSPMGGVVRYAGYFKNYGKIIIVEHEKDYHSLIAGLAKIDTVVGQSVAAGEPIGSLSRTSSDGGNPSLYYELRLNGEPVNPARKFAGL